MAERSVSVDKDIKKSISATDKDAQYDEKAKNLLGHKIILAHILVKTIDEFKGMNPKDVVQYIEGDFTSFECTEGGVYPEQIAISVTYGKDADIKIKNYSGKPVTVSADALEGSEVRIKGSGTINSQEGKLTISAGKAVSGTERVRLLITGENKVWYNGYIYLTYQEPVQLESALNAVSDGWEMRCSITNAGNDIVKGRLTLISPNEWHKNCLLYTSDAADD